MEGFASTFRLNATVPLSLFLYRLRRVIAEAAAAAPHPLAAEQRLRERVADALRKGMLVAVPAALAAGAVGLAFPAAAPAAAAAGLSAAVTPAGQELLKQAIQLAATSLLDKTLAGEPADASPKERLAAAWPRTRRAIYDLQVALVNLDRNPTPDLFRWVDALGIDGASSLYGLLQAGAEITPASQSYALQATAGRLVDLVHQARSQVTAPSVPKDASRISQDLAEETRKLEAVMGGWV